MPFDPRKTNAASITEARKTLLYATHGFGKTTQAKYYKKMYGNGFIISGEGGLSSISDQDIDYLHFSSWDGKHSYEDGVFSFKGIIRDMLSPEFLTCGYKWVMLDSLTEASDLCMAHYDRVYEEKRIAENKKNADGFGAWNDYNAALVGACKYIRDMPMHVIITALAKEEKDDNGSIHYWPMLHGQKAMRQIPGIFDNVLCGERLTRYADDDVARNNPIIERRIYTEQVGGWHGKLRTPYTERFQPVELTGDVTDILRRMDMTPAEWNLSKTNA
jgi:hypothetical protein